MQKMRPTFGRWEEDRMARPMRNISQNPQLMMSMED